MNRTLARLTATLAALALLACPIATPTPTPEPTATVTATATNTATPVVIVVTATPAPTPDTLVDMDDLYLLPPVELLAVPLVEKHGKDIRIMPWIGIPGDGKVLLQYEQPRGSGQWYIAVIEPGGGLWPLLGVIPVQPTPASAPAATPGPGREARK